MKGILLYNERLAPYTSWHIGGLADRYYNPTDNEDLAEFLRCLPQNEPLTWLGLGSNVLISDEGIRGTVIHTQGKGQIDLLKTGVVRVEAGVACAKVAKFCAKAGLIGGEFFAGIPGTVGGALAMNAGAFGGETWRQVIAVEAINRQGQRAIRLPSDYQIGYRSVIAPEKEEWFIAGHFRFEPGDGAASAVEIKRLLRQRSDTQPIGTFSGGSTFKNPSPDHAGRLIEECQLKGLIMGGAQISPKHANFIINLGTATANDVLQLIKHIQETVLREHQILLETEVRLLGF
jgi:UDP-N-acetylmuramate dehydrogenase